MNNRISFIKEIEKIDKERIIYSTHMCIDKPVFGIIRLEIYYNYEIILIKKINKKSTL